MSRLASWVLLAAVLLGGIVFTSGLEGPQLMAAPLAEHGGMHLASGPLLDPGGLQLASGPLLDPGGLHWTSDAPVLPADLILRNVLC